MYKCILKILAAGLCLSLLAACTPGVSSTAGSSASATQPSTGNTTKEDTPLADGGFNENTRVADVVASPAFAGFGQYLFPLKNRPSYDSEMTLAEVEALMPYHSAVQPATTVDVLNDMRQRADNGDTLFYDIYTEVEKQADSSLEDTGLFFFPGEPGAPFAIVSAGGGFSYVGSIHESFPHALELSRMGYNAFALEYRLGSGQLATEDLAAAISFVVENAEALGVNPAGYSLWGGSAGARMAANIGSYGPAAFGGDDIPRPAAVIIAYTGHSGFVQDDTPTFTNVSANDPIASAPAVRRRVEAMREAGITVEFEEYQSAEHGFGLGIGTEAEGWVERAAAFWEMQLDSR